MKSKDSAFLFNRKCFWKIWKKKEAEASFFCQNDISQTYFTMNFMVSSKPLALMVMK